MRRAPLPDLELRRAVWRHEYGYLSATRVGRVLTTQLGSSAADFDVLRPRLAVIRGHDPGLLHRWDEARGRGDDARRRQRYRDALEHLLRGRRLLEEMGELLEADGEVALADQAVAWLTRKAGAPRLRTLPSVAAPAQLLALARERTGARRWRAATALARACRAQAEPLQARDGATAADRAELAARFGAIRALCAATAALLPEGVADLADDGTLSTADALLAEGHAVLARRLADELELALAPRAQLMRELRRPGGDEGDQTLRTMRGDLAGFVEPELWTRATRWLWRARLAALPARPAEEDGDTAPAASPGAPEPAADDRWFPGEMRDL